MNNWESVRGLTNKLSVPDGLLETYYLCPCGWKSMFASFEGTADMVVCPMCGKDINVVCNLLEDIPDE